MSMQSGVYCYKKMIFQGLLVIALSLGLYTGTSFADGGFRWDALDEYDLSVLFTGKWKPEMFWGNRYSLLNENNPFDRVIYMRHTLDYNVFAEQGVKTYGFSVVTGKMAVRNKAIWGDFTSLVPTTRSNFKLINAIVGDHQHITPRNFFWIRELWMRFTIGAPIGLTFDHRHELTIGAFSFQLGRGIALGDAYATGPDYLGFYDDGLVDQYAYGANLSGDIRPNVLSYDLYAALLESKSSSLGQTGAKIYAQEYGRKYCPQRGYGAINFVVAGRLQWKVWAGTDRGNLSFEPYWVYNSDPEQYVEFPADASSKLGTIGLASEVSTENGDAGFDMAFNVGHQKVKGWDRNKIDIQSRNGVFTYINTHVLLNVDPKAANAPSDLSPYLAPEGNITTSGTQPNVAPNKLGRTEQSIINGAIEGKQFNGDQIGIVPGLTAVFNASGPVQEGVPLDSLYNGSFRFRDPYINEYHGWMLVADAAYWLYKKDLKGALAVGVASGDRDPNFDLVDGTFNGFIGLQEAYAGKRVKSAFLLGGAGRLQRPLAAPLSEEAPDDFSSVVNGFTNIVLVGGALTWTPQDWEKKFTLNPNLLAYWTYVPSNKFGVITTVDPVTSEKTSRFGEIDRPARPFLGVEMNLFANYYFLENMKWFFVGSLFIPGGHYYDIRGKPLNSQQNKDLDAYDPTDFARDPLPNIGVNTAMTLNTGFEYLF